MAEQKKRPRQSKSQDGKLIVGWSEYIDLPDWKINGLKAKVDTGARTSALHVEDIEKIPGNKVRFHVVLSRKKPRRIGVIAKIAKQARVRSSTGEYKMRYFVTTTLRLGTVEKEIELSLVSREKMLFRMLIGRKALEKDFLVDVSHRSMTRERPARKPKKTNSGTKGTEK